MKAQEKLGPVDMLVNCAGTSLSGKFEDVEVDNFKVSLCYYKWEISMASYLLPGKIFWAVQKQFE